MTITKPTPTRLGGFPDWARELDARLPVSPHIVLSGNVEDLHLVEGIPLWSTARTVGACLLANGYDAVLHWHVVTGLAPVRGSQEDTVARVLGTRRGSSRDRPTAADLSEVMHQVVHANRDQAARVGLIVDGAHRLAPDSSDLPMHAMYVAARHLVRTAPRDRVETDRRPGLYNTVVWVVDREADLPHWLVSADAVPVVSLPLPELGARQRAVELFAPDLPGYVDLNPAGQADSRRTLTELTEGMPLDAIRSIVALAGDRGVPAAEVQDAVRLLRSGLQTSPWNEPEIRGRILTAAEGLNKEVLGQERAVRTVTDILSRAALGLSGAQSAGHPSRPQGVIFFAGPTGVGKTELAKQIAKIVFGREEAMQRFDMSEFSAEHSEARLIGSPPGYVGHESGGELTNAVRQRPFSLLLFDEIEKADPLILDKFLQILEDGRLTDGSGSTVHFTETLIVFTSNLGIYQVIDNQRVPVVVPGTPYDKLESKVREAIHDDFTLRIGRPELLNRIGDNIVVFDFITADIACRLLHRNLDNVVRHVHRRTGLRVEFGPQLVEQLETAVVHPDRLAFGGRAVGSLIESRVLNPLARVLIGAASGAHYELTRSWEDAEGHHLDAVRRAD